MNSGLIFRKYQEADLPYLTKAFSSNVPKYFAELELADFIGFLKEDVFIADSYYDAVVFNDKIIGSGGIAQNKDKSISMCWGMIDAAYHKQGFGKKLLEHRLKLCGIHFPNQPITLSTTQHTFTFFEKYGFVTIETKNNFWAKDLHLYKMIWQTNT
jgi:[ribosomal protein S18]-alanine N-acetyltransferase